MTLVAHCRRFLDPHASAFPELRILVDPTVQGKDELRRRAGDASAMRYVIERPLQLGMLVDVFTNLAQALAGRLQALFEFGLGFHLGLAESHLHAAVSVDLALA